MTDNNIYSFKARTLAGDPFDLGSLRDKLVLVVNTASECGFTPQYAGLEELHRRYGNKGLAVLGFPCNQFGAQEPGSAGDIGAFCRKNYGVSFQMFDKIDVNGARAHPVYQWLKAASGEGDIEWNFVKFLVGPDGALIRRYPPKTRPEDIATDVEALLEG
jgi:glutathione peroxidase